MLTDARVQEIEADAWSSAEAQDMAHELLALRSEVARLKDCERMMCVFGVENAELAAEMDGMESELTALRDPAIEAVLELGRARLARLDFDQQYHMRNMPRDEYLELNRREVKALAAVRATRGGDE